MAGDVRQLNDIWSQSLTRGAAELRGFNYTNEHSIRCSQRQPGAGRRCHTSCRERTRTHVHPCTHMYSHTREPSGRPGNPGPDVGNRMNLSHTISLSLSPLYSSLAQLFFISWPAPFLLITALKINACSLRVTVFDKCK